MNETLSWEWVRSFLAVVDEGSLSGAARALGVAQPTVGRHIDQMEAALGVVLFTRSLNGFMPTELAMQLVPEARAMANASASLLRQAGRGGAEVQGVVRVTASEVMGVEVLPAILVGLKQRHPALKIELVLSNQMQDLLHREADIAVRMKRPEQEQLVARRIGDITLGLYAHCRYLDRHGIPASLDDLVQHDLIGFDRETAFIRQARQALSVFNREQFAFAAGSDLAQLALIRQGAGVGICQTGLAEAHPELVRLLPDAFEYKLDTWVTMHEGLRHNRACRAVFDGLVEGVQRYREKGIGM